MKKKRLNITINNRLIIIEIGAQPDIHWGIIKGYSIYHSPADKPISDDLSNATFIKSYEFQNADEALKAAEVYVKAQFKQMKKAVKVPRPKAATKKRPKSKKK